MGPHEVLEALANLATLVTFATSQRAREEAPQKPVARHFTTSMMVVSAAFRFGMAAISAVEVMNQLETITTVLTTVNALIQLAESVRASRARTLAGDKSPQNGGTEQPKGGTDPQNGGGDSTITGGSKGNGSEK